MLCGNAISFCHCQLQILRLTRSRFSDDGFKQLTEALKKDTELEELGLVAQDIDADRARWLSFVVAKSPNLRVLRLERNDLDDNATSILCTGLARSHIQTLVLDDNKISDSGAKALAAVIARGNLQSLSLTNNKIKAIGASALATALKSPRSRVTELSLAGNNIPRAGGEELKLALEEVETIVKFDMRQNWFSPATMGQIKKIMKDRRTNKKDTSDKIKR